MNKHSGFRLFALALFLFANVSSRCMGETTHTLPTHDSPRTGSLTSETLGLSKDVQAAFDILQKAEIFPISGYVGYAAETPAAIKAFQVIIKTKHADSLFIKLLAQKKITPRLIGLCGIYFTDPQAFLKEGKSIKDSGEMVQVMSGCMVYPVSARELVGPIEQAKIDAKGKLQPAPKVPQNNRSFVHQYVSTGELSLLFRDFRRNTMPVENVSKPSSMP